MPKQQETDSNHGSRTRRALVVLGMHRSGTSMLSGILGLLGGGMPSKPIKPGPDNPTGFWEPESVVDAHEELLKELNLLGHIPINEPIGGRDVVDWLRAAGTLDAWIDRLNGYIESDFADQPMIVIKDPRMCRLMPLWSLVFERAEIEPIAVLPFRHPAEVAGSLHKRNGLDFGRSMWMWMDHVLRAEFDTRSMPRAVVRYADLLTDWRTQIEEIDSSLNLGLDLGDDAQSKVDEFVSNDLRHFDSKQLESIKVPSIVQDAMNAYEQSEGSIDVSAFDAVARSFEEYRVFAGGWIVEAEQRCNAAYDANLRERKHSSNLTEQLNETTEQRKIETAAKDAAITELRAGLESKDSDIQRLNTLVNNQLAQHTEQLNQLSTRIEHSEQLRIEQVEAAQNARIADQELAKQREEQYSSAVSAMESRLQETIDQLHQKVEGIEVNADEFMRKQSQLEAYLVDQIDLLSEQSEASKIGNAIIEDQIRAISKKIVPGWKLPMHVVSKVLALPVRRKRHAAEDVQLVASSRLFDASWYLAKNPDVAAAGVYPAAHYVGRGHIEGREPSELFDAGWYLEKHTDVAQQGINPLVHYLRTGWSEGREIRSSQKDHSFQSVVPEFSPATTTPVTVEVKDISASTSAIQIPEVDTDQLARTTAVAFYLPQFHPIAENDEWWGKGFTEWRNVSRAFPQYVGHDQPLRPADLGYYDLRLPEVQERQAELAMSHGIGAFCYHHYWFNGRRLLERPLNQVLANPNIKMPFCICWANENWTRRWDGLEQEVLMNQRHTLASDRQFFLDLIPTLEDPRYLRVDGKPVIVIYRADLMQDPQDTAAVWRDEAKRAGLGDIHLCAVRFRTDDPRPLGFDAAIEFPPHHFPAPEITHKLDHVHPEFTGRVLDWKAGVDELIQNPLKADYRLYRGVNPGWDNTARRMSNATIFAGATPQHYEAWLRSCINIKQPEDGTRDNLVFINAWNEWAEGAILEPSENHGSEMLRATARAMGVVPPAESTSSKVTTQVHSDSQKQNDQAPQLSDKLKSYVRKNQTLNTIACRQPQLAQSVLRAVKAVQPEPKPLKKSAGDSVNGAVTDLSSVSWFGRARDESGTRTPAVFVSHDAARAGSQLLLLEIVRHIEERGEFEPIVILLGGGELESDFGRVARCCTVSSEAGKHGSPERALDVICDEIQAMDPAFAICASAVSVSAAQALTNRGITVLTLINELVTSMQAAYGPEKVLQAVQASEKSVCVSEFSRRAMIDAFDLPEDKVSVVYPGYLPHRSTQNTTKAAAKFRKKYNIPQDAKLVLGCGTVHPRKGPDLFIRLASSYLSSTGSRDTYFVWIGSGDPADVRWAQHDVEGAGISNRCLFVGQLPEVGSAFEASDIFALTSREDPFPLVGLEALSRGVPMLAFEGAGGAPEVIETDAGAVVPYLDVDAMRRVLEQLLNDSDVYASASKVAREKAETRHAFDNYLDDLLQLVGHSTKVVNA
jgi:glycosyltransferase involved in cell wall biosynthesis